MKKIILILLVTLFQIKINAQSSFNTFQRTYKTMGDEFGGSVLETSNGDFLTVGFTTNPSVGKEDAIIIRTNKFGHTLWTKTYGDTANQHFLGVIEDGIANEYYVVGHSEGRGTNATDGIFMKIDGNGNIIWIKAFGGNGIEQMRKIIKADDGGFFLIGYSTSPLGAGLEDNYIVKTNSTGAIQWTKVFGGTGNERIRSFAKDPSGNLVMVGFTQSFGAGGKDNFISKMDQNGNFIWSYSYGSNKVDKAQELVINPNGDIVVAGMTSMSLNINPFNPNAYLMKVDALGDKKWCRVYEDTVECEPWTLINGLDGGYVFATEDLKYNAVNDSSTNISLVKVDDLTGNVMWAKRLGGNKKDKRPEVIKTSDGGYFMVASTASFASDTMRNIYHVKTNTLGVSGCNTFTRTFLKTDTGFVKAPITWVTATDGATAAVTWTPQARIIPHDTLCENLITTGIAIKASSFSSINVYPNPSHGNYTLETSDENYSIVIRDILGKTIHKSKNEHHFDLTGNAPGLYFITVSNAQSSSTLKLVLKE